MSTTQGEPPLRHQTSSFFGCLIRVQIKCSRTTPTCTNCKRSGQECAYKIEDGRKNPVSKHYVASLERQIASLEDVFRQVRSRDSKIDKAPIFDALAMGEELRTLPFEDHCAMTGDQSSGEARAGKLSISASSLSSSPQQCTSYQGPTSIHRLGDMHGYKESSPARQDTAYPLYCINTCSFTVRPSYSTV